MHHARSYALVRSLLSLVLLSAVALTVPLDGTTGEASARGRRWHRQRSAAPVAPPRSVTTRPTTPVAAVESPPTSQQPQAPIAEGAPAVTQAKPRSEPAVPAPTPTPVVSPSASPAPAPADAAATDFFVGAYLPGAPADMRPVTDLQSRLGSKLSVVNQFQGTNQGFLRTSAANAWDNGSIPLFTLEFWDYTKGVDQPAFSLKSISSGTYDSYLRTYARDAKAFGKTVWLRPLHEMNGNWYPWGGTVNGNSPADFVDAWRHVRAIFTEEGATNVKFVWAPNNDSVPDTSANAIEAYWPGDDHVDYIALDGYNFGAGSSWSTWRSFSSVFGASYATVTRLSSKPLIITETGCSTQGGDKAAWIAEMFRVLPASFPRIEGIVWFNVDKERDWRIESSPESLSAFKNGFAGL